METGLGVGGDVEQALADVGVPSYVLDTTGIVRWVNPAAERLLGNVRGRHFPSVASPAGGRALGHRSWPPLRVRGATGGRPPCPRVVLPEGPRHRSGHRCDRRPGV